MKWNAIISRSHYKKSLQRIQELSDSLPGSPEDDERRLLRILVKDYETRQLEMKSLLYPLSNTGASPLHPSFI